MKRTITKSRDDIEQTVSEFSSTIFKTAYSYIKNRQSSEDILQNVLIKYMTDHTSFQDDQHKKAWLLRVTINECNSYYRKFHFHYEYDDVKNEDGGSYEMEKHDVYYAVMALPTKYRIIVHLYYYEQLSVNEISLILRMKENTVLSHLHRARKKLKKIMEVEYGYAKI